MLKTSAFNDKYFLQTNFSPIIGAIALFKSDLDFFRRLLFRLPRLDKGKYLPPKRRKYKYRYRRPMRPSHGRKQENARPRPLTMRRWKKSGAS